MSLGAGAGVPPYSPLPVSPSPMHNPYAQHIPQHPMQPYMGQPPTPVQSHGPYTGGPLSMRGQVPEGYGAQAQGVPNANGMPYYADMYPPAADPALFGRYANGHGQTAGPTANGPPAAAGPASPYGAPPGPYPPHGMINAGMRNIHHSGTPQVDPTGNGPSANNRKLGLYKTELCRSWEEKGSCRYGLKCQFAHGEEEIRKVARHPKYKTEICRVSFFNFYPFAPAADSSILR